MAPHWSILLGIKIPAIGVAERPHPSREPPCPGKQVGEGVSPTLDAKLAFFLLQAVQIRSRETATDECVRPWGRRGPPRLDLRSYAGGPSRFHLFALKRRPPPSYTGLRVFNADVVDVDELNAAFRQRDSSISRLSFEIRRYGSFESRSTNKIRHGCVPRLTQAWFVAC